MDRDEALELLRSQHAFPGPYRFRAVVRAGESAGVVTAVSAATEQVTDVEEAPSRKGTYVSLRVTARVRTAEEVLDVYEVLGRLEQVITTI